MAAGAGTGLEHAHIDVVFAVAGGVLCHRSFFGPGRFPVFMAVPRCVPTGTLCALRRSALFCGRVPVSEQQAHALASTGTVFSTAPF